MFQSLFGRDFPLRSCTYLLGLILNAQNTAPLITAWKMMLLSSYLKRGVSSDL
jgi:hypothetical protein